MGKQKECKVPIEEREEESIFSFTQVKIFDAESVVSIFPTYRTIINSSSSFNEAKKGEFWGGDCEVGDVERK